MKKFDIRFGALSPSLQEQLAGAGIDPEELERFDRDADAITRLVVREILTDTVATAARRTLLKKIQAAVDAYAEARHSSATEKA